MNTLRYSSSYRNTKGALAAHFEPEGKLPRKLVDETEPWSEPRPLFFGDDAYPVGQG